jgi:predicted transcriptional regulator
MGKRRTGQKSVKKTVPFSMRMDPELKDLLQRLADKDHRSLTNFIEKVLLEFASRQEGKE